MTEIVNSIWMACFLAVSATTLWAQNSVDVINYQGQLIENDVRFTGTKSITFGLYASMRSGTALWDSTADVMVQGGIFAIELAVPSTHIRENDDLYLGVVVNGNEIQRSHLGSVAYAFRAAQSDAVAPGSIDNASLAPNAVSVDKIAPNILSSLNNLVADGGNIDLKGRTNVVVEAEPDSNAIFFDVQVDAAGDHLGNHRATENLNLNGNWLSGDGDDEGIFVSNNGNVGVGTVGPTRTLEVSGDLRVGRTSGGAGSLEVESTAAGNHLLRIFQENGEPVTNFATADGRSRLAIDNTGNVGIGTDRPDSRLTVAGPIETTGSAGGIRFPDGSFQERAATAAAVPGVSRNIIVDQLVMIEGESRMKDVVTTNATAPADGFWIVTATAQATLITSGGSNTMSYEIREAGEPKPPDGQENPGYHWVGFDSGEAPVGRSLIPISIQRVLPAAGGENYTFIFEAADRSGEGLKRLWNPQITALFVPTNYGSVTVE